MLETKTSRANLVLAIILSCVAIFVHWGRDVLIYSILGGLMGLCAVIIAGLIFLWVMGSNFK